MQERSQTNGSRHWVDGFPELAAEWDHRRNGVLLPRDVPAGSALRVWWTCSRGPDHTWRAKPNNRTSGAGCPFCANRRVSVTNSLATLFPEIAAEWHPSLNGALTPADVVATATRAAVWRCARDPQHVFRGVVRHRTRALSLCPFCSNRRAAESNSLARLYPHLAAEWHPMWNGDVGPSDVLPGARRRVAWRCSVCDHAWRTSVSNRVSHGSGCPLCARRRSSSHLAPERLDPP